MRRNTIQKIERPRKCSATMYYAKMRCQTSRYVIATKQTFEQLVTAGQLTSVMCGTRRNCESQNEFGMDAMFGSHLFFSGVCVFLFLADVESCRGRSEPKKTCTVSNFFFISSIKQNCANVNRLRLVHVQTKVNTIKYKLTDV